MTTQRQRAWGLAANALFAIPLYAAWTSIETPPRIRAASAIVLVVTAVRPAWGLLLLAAFAPLSGYVFAFGGGLASSLSVASVTEILIMAFLLAGGLRLALSPHAASSLLARPAAVLAGVIATAGALGLAAQQQETAWPTVFLGTLWRHVSTDYFEGLSVFPALHSAAQWLEGLSLAVLAERVVRQDPHIRQASVPVLLAGATAAAATTWIRFFQISMHRPNPISAAIGFLQAPRIQTLYTDTNATASVYALYLVPAIWLAFNSIKGRHWYRLAVLALSLGLWLTHSRAAEGAAIVALAGLWLAQPGRARTTVALAVGVATIVLAFLILSTPRTLTQSSSSESAAVRVRMAQIAWQITAEAPWFGAGLGQFRQASRAFITPEFERQFPQTRVGENAHNNFLQILAELGAVGFASFLWLLWAAARPLAAAARQAHTLPAIAGIAGGILAFLVSCLAGHPLLIAEVLWLFLLVLGMAAGSATLPASPVADRSRWLAIGLMLAVLMSAPIRLYALQHGADLRRVVFGAGPVREELDGEVYRVADAHSLWFAPSVARFADVPLRLTDDSRLPCLVHLIVDGRPADAVRPGATEWSRVRLQFSPTDRDPVSRRIELQVEGPCRLLVGKIRSSE